MNESENAVPWFLRVLNLVRRWKSFWLKLIVVTIGSLAAAAITGIVILILFSVAFGVSKGEQVIGLFVLPVGLGSLYLASLAMAYVSDPSAKWTWKGSIRWILTALGMYFASLFTFIAVVSGLFEISRATRTSYSYETLVEREFEESEATLRNGQPVTLTRFYPQTIGNRYRVTLKIEEPYEIPRGPDSSSVIFTPDVELRIVHDETGAIIKSENEVLWDSPHAMFGASRNDMHEGLPGEINLNFTPTELEAYRIEFLGPPKGFAKYILNVEVRVLD